MELPTIEFEPGFVEMMEVEAGYRCADCEEWLPESRRGPYPVYCELHEPKGTNYNVD